VRVRGVYLAVVTIAFGIIVERLAVEWSALTNGWAGISNIPAPTLAGRPLHYTTYFYVVGAVALATFLASANVINSRFGRAMLASGQSEIAARSLGIDVTRIRTLAFVISAVAAGVAGVLYVFLNRYISPDIFTFSDSIRFLLMVILGGAGTVSGPIVGAGIISYLPELLQRFGEWQKFVYGALLAMVMFLLPRGILGTIADRTVARARPPATADEGVADGGAAGGVPRQTPSAAGTCLRAYGLSVRFGGLKALDCVNMTIEPARIYSLIGPNGAGKSTFLNAVSGIYRVTDGRIELFGEDISGLLSHQIARRGLARTFQNTELFPEMTALENVWVGFHSRYASGLLSTLVRSPRFRAEEEAYRNEAVHLLRFVGLSRFVNEKARNLPFGFQRRLEIARALSLRPRLLLLDEPAAGLTTGEIHELVRLIKALADAGITILLIEHHVDLIMAISDHVTVLDYGQVISEGPPARIQSDPRVIEAYLGSEAVGIEQARHRVDTPEAVRPA
jgi:branched-chain amino acid transport system ATP-binding protein/branched-chain amino acid transport system permease protein